MSPKQFGSYTSLSSHSTEKVTKRGTQIAEVEIEEAQDEVETEAMAPQLKAVSDD